MLIFALAYWGRNFLFIFWENWKNQKALSKLADLYLPIFENLLIIIFASVFKLSVHCTYSIGYRKCSPFFFFFMAFSWPFFLSFYTQDIACRHSLGELSLKKKNLNALHIFSLLGFLFFYSFSYILVSFCFLIHLLEIDCQCWLALQHHGPVPRALRLVKGKAIETGIILSILDIKCVLKKIPD